VVDVVDVLGVAKKTTVLVKSIIEIKTNIEIRGWGERKNENRTLTDGRLFRKHWNALREDQG